MRSPTLGLQLASKLTFDTHVEWGSCIPSQNDDITLNLQKMWPKLIPSTWSQRMTVQNNNPHLLPFYPKPTQGTIEGSGYASEEWADTPLIQLSVVMKNQQSPGRSVSTGIGRQPANHPELHCSFLLLSQKLGECERLPKAGDYFLNSFREQCFYLSNGESYWRLVESLGNDRSWFS